MWLIFPIRSTSSVELERNVFFREILFAWYDNAGNLVFLKCRCELWELDLKFSHFHVGHNRNQIDHKKATESASIPQNGTNVGIEEAKRERYKRNPNIHELESGLIHVVQGSALFEEEVEEDCSLEMINQGV